MTPNPPNSNCVVVLGSYRSGTSVTSRVLQHLGVNFGPDDAMFGGNRFNPGGYYERADINRANTGFIESAGQSLDDPGRPEDLVLRGDRSILEGLDFGWRGDSALWGLKDPRLCATLHAWLQFGLLDPKHTKLIQVIREPAQITRSVLEFPQVREYCDGTPEGARRMVERYLTLASWQTATNGIPSIHIRYEELVGAPQKVIGTMAAFLEINDPARVRSAVGEVGRRRGKIKLWTLDYPRRAARRLFRFLNFSSPRPQS